MSDKTFVYVTFIKSTPEKLWEALTNPEFIKNYWFVAIRFICIQFEVHYHNAPRHGIGLWQVIREGSCM